VVSVTVPPVNDPRVVPVGSVTVMVLPADPSRTPEDEVVNPIVQVESAPAADEDGVADNEVTDVGGPAQAPLGGNPATTPPQRNRQVMTRLRAVMPAFRPRPGKKVMRQFRSPPMSTRPFIGLAPRIFET
jgi:hypothetical protein